MQVSIGSILPVGSIIHSMLTTAQFASVYGDNWVLMDGRSVTGSLYASVTGNSTIPDATGRFLRGKGANNPDGDLPVGTYTADKFKNHAHTYGMTSTGSGEFIASGSYGTGYTGNSDDGSSETAPKSITVNIFIRIN